MPKFNEKKSQDMMKRLLSEKKVERKKLYSKSKDIKINEKVKIGR